MAEWLQSVMAGAQIANMRFERDARTTQLRQQAAQRQMQERAIAAQAQMYLQHAELYKAQAEQDKHDEALLKTAGDRFHTLWSTGLMTTEEALKESIAPLMFASPTAFQKAATGLAAMTRADTAGRTFTPSVTTLNKDTAGNPITPVQVLQESPTRAAQVKPTETPFTPSIRELPGPGGRMVPVLQGSKNSATQLREPGATTSQTTAMKDIAAANEMLKEARAKELAGDLEGANQLRNDALLLKDNHVKSGWSIQSDGQGGLTITQGNTKIPPMVVGKVLERLSQTEKAIDNLDDLSATLRPQDVGFKGVLGELFLDKILPQLGTATADVKRMDNRTKLRTLAENLMRQVSADSRFSNADRQAIAQVLPSAGMVESFEHTQQTIATLRKIFAKRALIDNKEAGQSPSEFAIRALDDEGLIEAAQSGLLTQEQALAAFRKRHTP